MNTTLGRSSKSPVFNRASTKQSCNTAVFLRQSCACAWLLALTAGTVATAQAQDEQLEEIQITGSRITRSTMETLTPVTTIQAAELPQWHLAILIEGLTQMPQFYGNQNQEQVNGGQNSGGSNVTCVAPAATVR